jgi:outer membrane protein OmpA-like peptidoglycan-associated protein
MGSDMRNLAAGIFALLVAACGGEANDAKAQAEGGQTAAAAEDQEPPRNLLTLAEGAVVTSASVDATRALSLTDGADGTTWTNGGPRYPGPFTFVLELRAPTVFSRVGVEGAGARPSGAAGAAARSVRIEGSSQSADAGFVTLGTLDASDEGESLIDVVQGPPMRWLRYTIETNHGNADWTYLDGVVAYGAQTPPQTNFTGIYEVGSRAYVELRQQGASISGCYVEQSGHANGAISGDVVDGVARLAWRRTDGPDVSGVALLVRDSQGGLNGVRYRDRSRSVWAGPPAPASVTTPCSEVPPPANPVSQALHEDGIARIYGILFDFDQATIKASSEPALRQLLAALQAAPALSVDIEGHSDGVGDDAYNLSLSERRAQAVMAWLVQNGVADGRLHAVGRGETQAVASNDTADGRALNRRVEVRRR